MSGNGCSKAFQIRGRVQGVGFRWWTRSQALRLGLSGSVRNRADGSVEVHLHGPDDAVETMEELLRAGPPGSWVTALDPLPPEPTPAGEFRILH